ncbi:MULTISPECIES: PPOX class F420-dependent oxidoreductase [Actinopolyspora]|uniref:PPOX class probable F420-dependent enzyme n=1 Tax=Actinopolyspora saharensis TaxID=995062 RepID=A0A1H1FLI6_9ACTN|nr:MULTISPECIES: PPOX class F420-dependent oxidoreductase [Actinopolyspora]NHD18866.1 PPOX class F420-dependent oxidoreductase [Actinopolyspora sp. BKK2]NHE77289.1 PPOX class F420-dependent oxidoreductase [Actinopolyspora sp. BKK1]SDR01346.1 PPOX class probable F420-dependent enzyme [Actinopolyspora saharensis]
MDPDQARSIVREQHHAVLATSRSDGTPQQSPVLATVDSEGRIVVSTTANTAKVANLTRDDRAWLCVLPDQFFGRWVQIEGRTEIVRLPEAMPLLEEYYRSVSGEHEDWEQYRAAMRAENRVLLRIEPTRAGPS